MSENLKNIPISEIKENPVALRTVKKDSQAYAELVDSIRNVGILNPITVRTVSDPATGTSYYVLVDGLHRFSGAQDAGLTEIPAHVLSIAEGDVLEAHAVERSASGRTGVYDVEVKVVGGNTVALFRGKSYRIKGEVIAGFDDSTPH